MSILPDPRPAPQRLDVRSMLAALQVDQAAGIVPQVTHVQVQILANAALAVAYDPRSGISPASSLEEYDLRTLEGLGLFLADRRTMAYHLTALGISTLVAWLIQQALHLAQAEGR